MGMSIDEAIEDLHAIQAYYNDDTQDGYIGFAKEDNESVDVAIEIMRKYQKIEQIVNSKTTRLSYEEGFRQIKKVVEDVD